MGVASNSNNTLKWSKLKLIRYSVLSILAILIVLEVCFRVAFFFNNAGLQTSVYIQGGPLKISDSLLVWKNHPLYVDYQRKFQYNQEGMKSEVSDVLIPAKQKGDFWVLLTGASAMEGMGSNKNDEWTDITGVEDYPYKETIGYFVQQSLQKSMPGRKVKVFNAACSGYMLYQSFYNWQYLSEKINADWVISMDGNNDPAILAKGQSVQNLQRQDWQSSPQFHWPLNLIVWLTRYSAFLNTMKQKLFHFKNSYRLTNNKSKNYPSRQKWLTAVTPPLQFAPLTAGIQAAADSFETILTRYDSVLTKAGKKHLLLIQPHLSLRDTTWLNPEETALTHYYRAMYNDGNKNCFMKILHYKARPDSNTKTNIVSMNAMHYWKEQVFVDYCHFTIQANKKIAAEISTYILSNGSAAIFKD